MYCGRVLPNCNPTPRHSLQVTEGIVRTDSLRGQTRTVGEEDGKGKDKEDDEGVAGETEICQVTHVTEEDLTEREEVDLLRALLDLEGWERDNSPVCNTYCSD
jgi:hypothetical protein